MLYFRTITLSDGSELTEVCLISNDVRVASFDNAEDAAEYIKAVNAIKEKFADRKGAAFNSL